ncbi:3-oxoacyl-[acyl-carrier-protein] reductase FabG [Colletotrichum orbiculare MAFF 240422]|uniref:3-oxoacyl-[acyl-carrier-protein] reductase FabG n=1 Tax=Colletotrichum orbiculare (strain 104-T / ATCC 96160 / CBS 514.97 / LARS 414 / MAFF 240422) TaxID=1213857 RepID=N4VVR4_COLOR|nr:3-oxoacyl-[acyl-carrier-protein] reductase FabG [Colletotrichum orbiculare MAFF 240422]
MSGSTPLSFYGKVVAVTGAASGIGRAVAIYLASRGASLAISDVQGNSLEETVSQVTAINPGARVKSTVVDVRKPDQVKNWIENTVLQFGHLDGAANIAGTGGTTLTRLEDQTDEDWNLVIDVNLSGTMFCMREQLKHLSDGGSIVNASSVLGLRSSLSHGISAYVASKHGVLGLTRNAAREYGHRNIRVNCVNPGAIDTPMLEPLPGQSNVADDLSPPIARMGKPEEVAALVGFLLGDESTYISGTSIVIDGGLFC